MTGLKWQGGAGRALVAVTFGGGPGDLPLPRPTLH